eukprot:3941913-Rhodomonas_salina.6
MLLSVLCAVRYRVAYPAPLSAYVMAGTDMLLRCMPTPWPSGTDIAYAATSYASLQSKVAPPLSCYALATRCPVLTRLSSYALSSTGTDLRYPATHCPVLA